MKKMEKHEIHTLLLKGTVISAVVALGVGTGLYFTFRSAPLKIDADFYSKPITLNDEVNLQKQSKSAPSVYGGKTGGGGDPRARVTRQGVLGVVSGRVTGSSAMRQSEQTRSATRSSTAGIGYGIGTGGTDALLDNLMGGSGTTLNLKKRSLAVGSSGSVAPIPQPVVSSNEEYMAESVPGIVRTVDEPLSTFSIDVDAASYSNVRRMIRQGALPPKGAVRVEEMINYFTYNYPEPTGKHPFSITSEVSECPWNKDHYLAHIGIQGKQAMSADTKPSNLVFLIDVSGSMQSPQKLPLVVRSLSMLTDQLSKNDRISIAVYAGAAGTVLEPTRGDNKRKIKNALNRLRAGGSTAGGAGIRLAYDLAKENFLKNGNNRVIIATDGDFNVGISRAEDLTQLIESRRDEGIFLSVLGFGQGNYKDYRMEQLADKGNGNYSYIDNILEAKKVLVTEMKSTLFTIAKDVKIQVEFNPTTVAGYRLIGYENRRLAKEDFNDDTKDAGELGAGHTVTALYEIVPVGAPIAPSVDPLKYQKEIAVKAVPKESYGDELFTVKFRYKKPEGTTSILLSDVVKNSVTPLKKSSNNFRWSTAVCGFGTALDTPQSKSSFDMKQVIAMARDSRGEDPFGYRAEFIQLAEQAEIMIKERY